MAWKQMKFPLQAVDVKLNVRWYFDPLHSKERKVDGTSDNLCSLIDKISQLIRVKTGWKCTEWPCVEPLHHHQEDSYDCGVIICLYSLPDVQLRLNCNGRFSMRMERQRMASTLLGSCYNDIARVEGIYQRRWWRKDPSPDFKGKSCFCCASGHLEIQEHQPED